jgi:hypothetical protein
VLENRNGAIRPGRLITSGDIDNRLKTLFDSLRILGEVPAGPTEDKKPFYVLLEDDKPITHISVETDTLLERVGTEWDENDVRLGIVRSLHSGYVGAWILRARFRKRQPDNKERDLLK